MRSMKTGPHQHKEPAAPGALALCWAMLRRLLTLLVTPGADTSIAGLMAELERAVCLHIFREALALDPTLSRFNPGQLRLVWRNSRLHIDYADDARPERRFSRAAALAHINLILAQLRALRRIPVLHALRGSHRFNRRAQIVISCERRRHTRRRRSSTHQRSRAPTRAHPLALIPP
jgi:hypothetical protein